MLFLIVVAIGVMLTNVVIQMAAVLTATEYVVRVNRYGRLGKNWLYDSWILGLVLVRLLIAHLAQIAVWAASFLLAGEFDTFRDAFYHSAVNFASLGYGDLVMSEDWRLLGALEASVGVMMFGISAAMMFAAMSNLLRRRLEEGRESPPPAA